MTAFFTSDTHFGHRNILQYCNRPFSSVEEMDEHMIRVWNETVGVEDTIFHLGDFSFYNTTESKRIIDRLNGHKILVAGNHDKREIKELFDEVYNQFDFIKDAVDHFAPSLTRNLRFQHTPKISSPDCNFRHILVGHVHTNWASLTSVIPSDRGLVYNYYINVGIDVWKRPISIERIMDEFMNMEKIKDLSYPVNHAPLHGDYQQW